MLDLDHFKQINDRYGHGIGDNVLQEFSALLCQHCPPDGVVARLGGEEFAIWLPGMLSDKAQALAEQIRAATEALVACEEIRFTVSIAVGIGQAGEAVEALVKRTDLALYRAKHLGRNRVELA
jgi:diguanylate cyclase (GGDEF)-like protein